MANYFVNKNLTSMRTVGYCRRKSKDLWGDSGCSEFGLQKWRTGGWTCSSMGMKAKWARSPGQRYPDPLVWFHWYLLVQSVSKKKNSEKEWIHNKSFKICSQLKETLIYWRQARYPCSETWFRYTNSITYCTSMTKSIYPGTLNVQRSWARKGT